jgi:uncharacterized protein involved in type VI secretion and phage assembly
MSEHLGRTLKSAYAQYGRVIKLDTPAGVDRLVPLWVKGTARLGRDYEFVIEAAALRDDDEVDARKLLGNAITLWIQQTGGAYLPVHGYVHGFFELGRDGSCIYYQLRFSSWLYFLRLRRDQRDWQEASGEQILCDVFGEHHRTTTDAFRFALSRPMPQYSYRMQSEFDLHFVYRSMEEAGVFGRFEFAADGRSHTFVIMDDVFDIPPLAQGAVELGRAGRNEEFDGFQSWRERLQLRSARLETCTFDYKRPDYDRRIHMNAAAPDSLPVDGTVYDYTGAYSWGSREDGERQACTRVEAWESQIQRFDAVGSLRAAMPGLRYTLDRRKGDEVLIDFVGGDCDRPVIVSRVCGGATEPVWHTNGVLSGLRSKEYHGRGFNQLVLDDSTGQNRVQLYSSSYQSHLHFGYLVRHENNHRGAFLGSGFDLKSDAYGALRAAQGLFVSTHPTSTDQPLDVTAAADQLAGAQQVADIASKASSANQAEGLDDGLHSLHRFTQATRYRRSGSVQGGRTAGGGDGTANGFGLPVMLLASPAGLGLSTQDSLQATASQHVNLVSGRNTQVAAGKSFLVSAMEKMSLFVQNAGMKLFAAKGKVEIQAQGDAMALSALKDITITSSNGRLVLSADKEVWIGAGGSYIRITGDLIENGTTGQILEKCANWDKPGAASMRVPATLASVDKGCAWKTVGAAGEGASNVELS